MYFYIDSLISSLIAIVEYEFIGEKTIYSEAATNIIHHWCTVWTGKSQLDGPPLKFETKLRPVSH